MFFYYWLLTLKRIYELSVYKLADKLYQKAKPIVSQTVQCGLTQKNSNVWAKTKLLLCGLCMPDPPVKGSKLPKHASFTEAEKGTVLLVEK